MRRREFIAGLGGAAAWPLVGSVARSGVVPKIGYLSPGSSAIGPLARHDAFQKGLAELGYVDGKDIAIEYRFADRERLASYPFYFAALGELEFRRARYSDARNNFEAAQTLARNAMERQFFGRRLAACERGGAELAFFELFWDRALESLPTQFAPAQ